MAKPRQSKKEDDVVEDQEVETIRDGESPPDLPRDAFANFTVDETASLTMRYVAILLYAVEHYPGAYVPRNLIVKIANRRAAAPPANSREARAVSLSHAKIVLSGEPYKRALLPIRAGGYRLGVNHEESMRFAMPPAQRRLESATHNTLRVAGTIDITKVAASPEKTEYQKYSSSVLERLRSPAFLAELALPDPARSK